MRRLEHGEVLFSLAEGGVLLHYSWLAPPAKQMGSEFGHTIPAPGGRAVLWDDFTHPAARSRGLHQESLRARLRHAAEHRVAEWCAIGVRADNGPSRHNIEKVGFEYCGSAWLRVRCGAARRWVDVRGAPFEPPPAE